MSLLNLALQCVGLDREKMAEDFAIGFGLYVLVNNGKFKYIDLD